MENFSKTALRESGNGFLHNGNEINKGQPIVSTTGTFMKLKTYLLALRPWSLSASLVPTLLGSALAFRSQWSADFSFVTFFLTAFTVVTVHCAGNVVNTYFDFIKGIDKQKADDRTLVDHILTKDEVSYIPIKSAKFHSVDSELFFFDFISFLGCPIGCNTVYGRMCGIYLFGHS